MNSIALGILLLFSSSIFASDYDRMMSQRFSRPSGGSCSSSLSSSSGSRSLFGASITPEDYRAARGDMNRAAAIAGERSARESGNYRPSGSSPKPLPSPQKLHEQWLFGPEITPEDYRAGKGDMNRAREEAGRRAARELAAHGVSQNPYTGKLEERTYSAYTPPILPSPEKQREYALYGAEITPEDYREAGGNMHRAREVANKRIQDLYARARVRLDPFTGTLIPLDPIVTTVVVSRRNDGSERLFSAPIMPEDFVKAKGNPTDAQRVAHQRERESLYSRMITESDLRKVWHPGVENDLAQTIQYAKRDAHAREVVPGASFSDSRVFDPTITAADMRVAAARTSTFPDMLSFARAEATVRIANRTAPSVDLPLFDSAVTYEDLISSASKGGDVVTILERAAETARGR